MLLSLFQVLATHLRLAGFLYKIISNFIFSSCFLIIFFFPHVFLINSIPLLSLIIILLSIFHLLYLIIYFFNFFQFRRSQLRSKFPSCSIYMSLFISVLVLLPLLGPFILTVCLPITFLLYFFLSNISFPCINFSIPALLVLSHVLYGHIWLSPLMLCCELPYFSPESEKFHWLLSINPLHKLVNNTVIINRMFLAEVSRWETGMKANSPRTVVVTCQIARRPLGPGDMSRF